MQGARRARVDGVGVAMASSARRGEEGTRDVVLNGLLRSDGVRLVGPRAWRRRGVVRVF